LLPTTNALKVAWSIATIAGVPINKALPEGTINQQDIANKTKDKAASIIDTKGATNYGIGAVTSSICKSILHDHRNIRPVSHFVEDLNCCISVLTVLGRKGIVRTLPVQLSKDEQKMLEQSARSLREIIEDAEKHENDA
jgi:L-lactate dehydrogenase